MIWLVLIILGIFILSQIDPDTLSVGFKALGYFIVGGLMLALLIIARM